MIRIEMLNYRSLRYVCQEIGQYQFLVGSNAVGKSNFLDAIVFIRDMLNYGPRAAVLGGEPWEIPGRVKDARDICWRRGGNGFQLAIELAIPEDIYGRMLRRWARARYEVSIKIANDGEDVSIDEENLWLVPVHARAFEEDHESEDCCDCCGAKNEPPATIMVYPGDSKHWNKVIDKNTRLGQDCFRPEFGESEDIIQPASSGLALVNLPDDEANFPVATWVKRVLSEGIQQIELDMEKIRRGSLRCAPTSYCEPDGSNIATLVEKLRSDASDRFIRWVEHLRTAMPDLRNVQIVAETEAGRRHVVLEHDNGFKAPLYMHSDGTVRLLALTLLAYSPNPDRIYLIEEPERSIAPNAMQTVYDSLASLYHSRVLCTSQSPTLLTMTKTRDLLCFSKTADGATEVIRGDVHPRLRDLQQQVSHEMLCIAGVL